jgi:hypothetical protein
MSEKTDINQSFTRIKIKDYLNITWWWKIKKNSKVARDEKQNNIPDTSALEFGWRQKIRNIFRFLVGIIAKNRDKFKIEVKGRPRIAICQIGGWNFTLLCRPQIWLDNGWKVCEMGKAGLGLNWAFDPPHCKLWSNLRWSDLFFWCFPLKIGAAAAENMIFGTAVPPFTCVHRKNETRGQKWQKLEKPAAAYILLRPPE